MASFRIGIFVVSTLLCSVHAQNIVNGQIYTPGIAIVDAPQPNTPLGGDFLQVALDVTADGQIQLPPYPKDYPTGIYNITIFLYSYISGKNLTITNGTASAGNASLGDIMQQEPGSTVKHVNWVWPDCLVGDGVPTQNNTARGAYNISIHQNFRLNNTNEYTIFDLPIQVTNSIPAESNRSSCDSLNNNLLTQAQLNASANNFTLIPGTPIIQKGQGNGSKSAASPTFGLGGADASNWHASAYWGWIATLALVFAL